MSSQSGLFQARRIRQWKPSNSPCEKRIRTGPSELSHLLIVCLLCSSLVRAQVTDSVFIHEGIVTGDYSGLPDQDHPEGPGFGSRVAIDGDWLAVSAPLVLGTAVI
jgi:hypothetical protein